MEERCIESGVSVEGATQGIDSSIHPMIPVRVAADKNDAKVIEGFHVRRA